jgi:FkbM family methyltransferase
MFLDTRDVGFAAHIIMDGFWEYWVTQFMIDTIKPGFVVLDIGANFGYYSLLLSDLVGSQGLCFAAEPNPEAAKKLRKNLAINGFASRSRVLPFALGREPSGHARFLVPTEEPKNACVVGPEFSVTPGLDARIEHVEMTSVDAIFANEPRIDFIKIDAEGSELNIILGMLETLRRCRPKLLLEFNANKDYDAELLLTTLSEVYCKPRYLDYDAILKEINRYALFSQARVDDWMIYFE